MMNSFPDDNCPWRLLVVIVDHGSGSKVLKHARQAGIRGGTIFFGRGTAGIRKTEWFGNYEVRKEIVIMAAGPETVEKALSHLTQVLKLYKPNHGIAFTMPVVELLGSINYCEEPLSKEGNEIMEKAIFVIVDRGNAETVVKAAEDAGAQGATIIKGRGAGVHETSKLFLMEIEPEKEIVLILCDDSISKAISEAIVQATDLNEPGKGILFIMNVEKTMGLFRKQ